MCSKGFYFWGLFFFFFLCLSDLTWAGDVSPPSEQEQSNLHVQATTVTQVKPSMNSPYLAQPNGLSAAGQGKTSFTSTLYSGYRVGATGSVYLDAEVSAGEGLSGTKGVAGYPNGETYRIDSPNPKLFLSRIYYSQIFSFGGEQETLESDKNQLAGKVDRRRITAIIGRFSLNDFFDDNQYSHDPRTQFLNWSLMDNGAWDYAADTRGYSWGGYLEYNSLSWAVRGAWMAQPQEANQLKLDPHLWNVYGANLEVELRGQVRRHPVKARLLSFLNRAHMGSYSDAIALAQRTGGAPDITATRDDRMKYGFGINLEQEFSAHVGGFLRAGWNDGKAETWNFTEVDQTVSIGFSLDGALWNRHSDHSGFAFIVNGISREHSDYLAAGGSGFLLGDGQLNYVPEELAEAYYLFQMTHSFGLTTDAQFIDHPGYNADRGPAWVGSLRLHFEI